METRVISQSIGGTPHGNQYSQWETVDNQTNHYCEIKNVGVFPVTDILGKTLYLAFNSGHYTTRYRVDEDGSVKIVTVQKIIGGKK